MAVTTAEQAYVFRHAVARDVAYRLQLPSALAAMHALALEILEQVLQPGQREAVAAELADHARLGAMGATAGPLREAELRYLHLGAAFAQRAYDNPEATRLWLAVADHPLSGNLEAARACLEAAGILRMTGRHGEADALLARVDPALPGLGGAYALARSEQQMAAGAYREAATALPAPGAPGLTPREHMMAARQRAALLERLGEYDAALAAVESGESLAGVCQDNRLLGALLSQRALLAMRRRDLDAALALFRQAEALLQQAGDRRAALAAIGNRGHVLRRLGDAEGGLDCYRAANAAAAEIGDLRGVLVGHVNVGNALNAMGRQVEAIPLYEHAIALARETGDDANLALATSCLGNAFHGQGRLPQALECYASAAVLNRRLGTRLGLSVNLSNQGQTLNSLGRHAEALPLLREALELMTALGQQASADAVTLRQSIAEALLRTGNAEAARAEAQGALEDAAKLGITAGHKDAALAAVIRNLQALSGT